MKPSLLLVILVIAIIAIVVVVFYNFQSESSLNYQYLAGKNDKLSKYVKSGYCVRGSGFVYFSTEANSSQSKLHILTLNNEIVGLRLIWPASKGWAPYSDMPQNITVNVSSVPSYTQTIYFKKPPTAEDCASALA